MKIALLVTVLVATLLAISSSAEGQVAAVPASKEGPSIGELIRADRAKAKEDEESASKDRPWDRDANGKRPWDGKERHQNSPARSLASGSTASIRSPIVHTRSAVPPQPLQPSLKS